MRYLALIPLCTAAGWAAFPLSVHAAETMPDGAVEVKMAASPALAPDGKTIVFTWREDLWKVPVEGGRAHRLTQHPARDGSPCFSPDGKKLYFSSSRAGAMQLFSMPTEGGPATQHTFHSEGATLLTITPDGQRAILRGLRDHDRVRPQRLIEVDLQKDAPERVLFDGTAEEAAVAPEGTRILFSRDGDGIYRKGYRGSRASSIWSFDRTNGTFTSVEKSETEARWPLWTPDGSGFYYVSERDGTGNLQAHNLASGKDEALTHFTGEGVMFPALSQDGKTFVFRRGFDLWRFQPGSEPTPLRIWAVEDFPDLSRETHKIAGTSDADFSPSGLELAFSSEGELFTMDTVLREPHRITETDAYESDPQFTKDGTWLYFRKDDGLTSQYWRMKRSKAGAYWWQADHFDREQVTKDDAVKSQLLISPDDKQIAYVSGTGSLCVAQADGSQERVLFTSVTPPQFDWSPDGKWLAFAADDENYNRDIYVVPTDGSREPFDLSRHPDYEGSPRWSPDGRMIAFTGRRSNNRLGLYYVHLRLEDEMSSPRDRKEKEAISTMRDDPLYRAEPETKAAKDQDPEPKNEPTAPLTEPKPTDPTPGPKPTPPAPPAAKGQPDEPESEADKGEKKKAGTKKKEIEPVHIDFEELSERVHKIDTGTTEPGAFLWSQDAKALLFLNADAKKKGLSRVEVHGDATPTSFHAERGTLLRVNDKGALYWIVDSAPAMLRDGKLTTYPIATRVVMDRREFQRLCFRMIWRTLRDRFYDTRMNGRDWEAMRVKYEDMAANANESRTFDTIAAMLFGELNASHLGFLSKPWPAPWADEGAEFRTTRHVGLRYDHGNGTGPLRVASVIPDSPAARCVPPVQPGDTIVAVDGRPVDATTPEPSFLNGPMDRDLTFTLRDASGKEREVELKPITWAQARDLAGDAILAERRRRVEESSGGKLGYIHIARMHWNEFEEFERQIHAAGHGKDGLVIDVRDNGGGFITDHLLTVLCQPRHAVTFGRDGKPGYPQDRMVYASWHKPITVLCNQNSYSNAEVFSHAIKTLKRGPLVGVATAGGVISTGDVPILDAGTMRVPFRGWFLPDSGEDMELNGAKPDYPVDMSPADPIAGRDPQLAKAVEVLLGDLKKAETSGKAFTPHYRFEPKK